MHTDNTSQSGDPVRVLPPAPRGRNPLVVVLGLFNSVWLGIVLMVLILAYMSVASAGVLRPLDWTQPLGPWQRWVVRTTLGMTEMEAFQWWPFIVLLGLFVTTLVVVTVRRIRFNVLNLGVWTIHTGIVTLTAGSVYYFATKLEGDTLVFRRSIVIEAPGAAPVRLVAQLGAAAEVAAANGTYRFTVQSIDPNWPLLSGADAGKTACSVNVAVTTPQESFIRQMLIGYPQYTEDIIPGQGRAIKVRGRKLIAEDLRLSFAYEPQDSFYLMDSAALYVREVGATDWIERPIEGLPHYANHIATRDEIWQPPGDGLITPNPLNLPVPDVASNDPLAEADVRITGRLHYVEGSESRWLPGGDQINPYVAVELVAKDTLAPLRLDLLALDPAQNSAKEGMIAFRWAQSAADIEGLVAEVGNVLKVRIPGEGVEVVLPVDEQHSAEARADDPFLSIAGSGWSYRIGGFSRALRLRERTVSVVSVEFRKGEETIKRFVFAEEGLSHDRSADGDGPTLDPRIDAHYQPGPAVLIVGGPGPTDLCMFLNGPQPRIPLALNEAAALGPGLSLVVRESFTNARLETRLAPTPERLQDANLGAQLSRVKVEIAVDKWSTRFWLPYHHYPFPDGQYAGNRFPFAPQQITLPGGRQVELLFSRKRWPLTAAVALEDFELLTHVGGFDGNTTSVRNFISRLRSYRDGRWSEPYTTSLNEPASDGGMYYFQSTWDPGTMAYTGLGVGNRNGVYVQLVGCCVAVLGMIYVFYVKPIIKRRRRMVVWTSVAAAEPELAPTIRAESVSDPAQV